MIRHLSGWIWIALSWLGVVVLLAGWRNARPRQRTASVMAVTLCLLCVALALNVWVGYVPTLSTAWDRLIGAHWEAM
jgi:nitric oxide reductase large subunit